LFCFIYIYKCQHNIEEEEEEEEQEEQEEQEETIEIFLVVNEIIELCQKKEE
jgi:hypothetical protein